MKQALLLGITAEELKHGELALFKLLCFRLPTYPEPSLLWMSIPHPSWDSDGANRLNTEMTTKKKG